MDIDVIDRRVAELWEDYQQRKQREADAARPTTGEIRPEPEPEPEPEPDKSKK